MKKITLYATEKLTMATFLKKTKTDGKVEVSTFFGRSKDLVLLKSKSFFYINIYDNRVVKGKKSTDKIGLGLDELDELIKLRPHLERAKKAFQRYVVTI